MKTRTAARIAALAACIASATTGLADFVPPNLPAGSQYQLIFVTADGTAATSADIDYYNAFVTAEAALDSSLPATNWHAVASTATIDANVNAPSLGLPVYNPQGVEVASTGLYTATLLNPIEPGPPFPNFVWTGSNSIGVGYLPGYTLGGGSDPAGAIIGAADATDSGWAEFNLTGINVSLPLYGLSDPITVPAPEPSTVALAVAGLFTWVAAGLRRHTAAALHRANSLHRKSPAPRLGPIRAA